MNSSIEFDETYKISDFVYLLSRSELMKKHGKLKKIYEKYHNKFKPLRAIFILASIRKCDTRFYSWLLHQGEDYYFEDEKGNNNMDYFLLTDSGYSGHYQTIFMECDRWIFREKEAERIRKYGQDENYINRCVKNIEAGLGEPDFLAEPKLCSLSCLLKENYGPNNNLLQ